MGKFYPPVSGGMERVLESLCLVSAGLVESAVLVSNTGRNTVRKKSTSTAGTAIQTRGRVSLEWVRSALSGPCTLRPTSWRSCGAREPT